MLKSEVKYPNIKVKLIGQDGNIFNLIGISIKAMRKAKVKNTDINSFIKDVTSSSNYDEALAKIMDWVVVE